MLKTNLIVPNGKVQSENVSEIQLARGFCALQTFCNQPPRANLQAPYAIVIMAPLFVSVARLACPATQYYGLSE